MESKDVTSGVLTKEKALPQEQPAKINAVPDPGTKDSSVLHEEDAPKVLAADELPSPDEFIERLGIENWREVEKKLVHRLDMTLLQLCGSSTSSITSIERHSGKLKAKAIAFE